MTEVSNDNQSTTLSVEKRLTLLVELLLEIMIEEKTEGEDD